MKIKQVQISGFRAFDKVENSTFDFTRADGNPANFISIYAPNGFGKTSFYDAVEWCVTDKIRRFARLGTENEKLIKDQTKANNLEKNKDDYFLVNRNSEKDMAKYVTVLTQSKESVRFHRELNDERYNFKNIGENDFFNDVILAQETIDAFLREENAEDRYSKFVQSFPQLNIQNENLQKLKFLIEANHRELEDLTTEFGKLKERQLTSDFAKDSKVLQEINIAISDLIELKEDIQLINPNDSTELNIEVLTNKINSRLTFIIALIEELTLRINNLDNIYNGFGEYTEGGGVVEYYINRLKREGLTKDFDVMNGLAMNFNNRTLFSGQILNLEKEINQLRSFRDELKTVVQKFDFFKILENKIENDNAKVNSLKSSLTLLETALENIKNEQVEANNSVLAIQGEIERLNEVIQKAPAFNLNKNQNDIKIRDFKTRIGTLQQEIRNTEEFIMNSVDFRLNEIDLYFKNLENSASSVINHEYSIPYIDKISAISASQEQEKLNDVELAKIIIAIDNQNSLNDELSRFISKGLELINKEKLSTCPLCTEFYSSSQALVEKVTNNSLLSENLKTLFNKRSEIENEISESVSFVEKEILSLKNVLLEPVRIEKNSNTTKLQNLNDDLNLHLGKLKDLQSENSVYDAFFEGMQVRNFIKSKNDLKKELQDSLTKENNKLSNKSKELNQREIDFRDINLQIENTLREIERNKNEEDYVYMSNFFVTNITLSSSSSEVVAGYLNNAELELEKLNSEYSLIKKQIESVNKILNDTTESLDSVDIKIKDIQRELEAVEKKVANFEQLIFSNYGFEIKTMTKTDVDNEFAKLKDKEKVEKSSSESILLRYRIINKLKEDTFQFLEFENTNRKIKKIEEDIVRQNNVEVALTKEKENLQQFLKTNINSFFHQSLINQLYSKIEPHPDYDKIGFECDFDNSNPRLQIYTINIKGMKTIPSLYFSSAQVNILSLSVFLARALNAKNDNESIDCIFIDDPIQSMDSINILSYIDLFRSLIANYDKQIIVSTHEENFHNLLQRKIPSELFSSKFMEFETFGKVKV